MKTPYIILLVLFSLFTFNGHSQVSLEKLKKEASKIKKPTGSGLTNDEVIRGLREALQVGTNNSAASASKVDGYFKNPRLFIPFPKDAQKVEKALRQVGMGKIVDDFVLSLNRAAEEAAKEAAPIFIDAIKKMTIQDAMGILKGNETAATAYLENTTRQPLVVSFTPVIDRALQKTQATRYWSQIITAYNKLPTTTSKVNPNLSEYATAKAIDGLFFLVGEEEKKIRKDPAARVSDILKKVFGK